MEIYAPLAHRLGIQNIKWELEDISIKYLDPVGYGEIMSQMADKGQQYEDFLQGVKKRISEKLLSMGIPCEMKARVKHVYSIYRKDVYKRQTLVTLETQGYKLNILDTPGYFDFAGEVAQALRVAGCGLIVVSAKDGVNVGTEKAWRMVRGKKLPSFFYEIGRAHV